MQRRQSNRNRSNRRRCRNTRCSHSPARSDSHNQQLQDCTVAPAGFRTIPAAHRMRLPRCCREQALLAYRARNPRHRHRSWQTGCRGNTEQGSRNRPKSCPTLRSTEQGRRGLCRPTRNALRCGKPFGRCPNPAGRGTRRTIAPPCRIQPRSRAGRRLRKSRCRRCTSFRCQRATQRRFRSWSGTPCRRQSSRRPIAP